MRKSGFFLIPYLLFSLFILAMGSGFIRNNTYFSDRLDNIKLYGYRIPSAKWVPSLIRQFTAETNGLELPFSPFKSIILITDDGIKHYCRFHYFEKTENEVILYFSQGLRLKITPDKESSRISISPLLPQTRPPVQEIQLPVRISKGSRLERDKETNLQVIRSGSANFYLSLPGNITLNDEENYLLTDMTSGESVEIVLEESLTGKGGFTRWFNESYAKNNAVNFEADLSKYLKKSSVSLLSQNDIMVSENERLGRKSVRNPYYPLIPDYLKSIMQYDARNTPIISRAVEVYLAREKNTLNQNRQSYTPPLKFYSLLSALQEDEFTDDLVNLFLSKDFEGSDYNEIFSWLLFAIECHKENNEFSTLGKSLNILDEFYFPNLVNTEAGILFENSSDQYEIMRSLQLGILLQKAAPITENSRLDSAGKLLILTALKYSDDEGNIPVRNNDFSQSYTPSDIYSFLVTDHTLQEFYKLKKNWIMTRAEIMQISQGEKEWKIQLKLPAGSQELLVISPVETQPVVIMHGRKRNPSRSMMTGSEGWYYNRENKSLSVKLKHRVVSEDLIFKFD